MDHINIVSYIALSTDNVITVMYELILVLVNPAIHASTAARIVDCRAVFDLSLFYGRQKLYNIELISGQL